MSRLLRAVLMLGMILGAGSLAPLAVADTEPSVGSTSHPGATPAGTPTPSSSAPSSPSGTPTTSGSPGSTPSSPSTQPTPTTSPSGPATGATTPSAPTSSTPAVPQRRAAQEATQDPTLVTKVSSGPGRPSLSTEATIAYHANRPGVRFHCRLVGPERTDTAFTSCPRSERTDDASNTYGQATYHHVITSPDSYTFNVQAYIPAQPATDTTPAVPEVDGTVGHYDWRVYSVYSPDHYSPARGARFNRPTGNRTQRRPNLYQAIRTIDSMPGYLQGTKGGPCPTRGTDAPSTIRVSLYSMTDHNFAAAMLRAAARCVSVQILMNNHLSDATDPAWRLLSHGLGTHVFASNGEPRRNFAHRCHFGCRGHGVLHTKMYLFDSQLPKPAHPLNLINDTVMIGSSNMTSNAASVQWNDLYTIRGDAELHSQAIAMFNRMRTGHKSSTMYHYDDGEYAAYFWPQGSASDPYQTQLSAVHCTGATGGSGIDGHTAIYINMHAWFGTRGEALAHQVRGLYNKGCYVRVLYSFMSYTVYKILVNDTNSRMSARRSIFSHNGVTAYLYSHMKNVNISGNLGDDSSSWVVDTGSNNFTNDGVHYDEVQLRIRSHSAYDKYVKHFKYISATHSSSVYAHYDEPSGGGRAPGLVPAPLLTDSPQSLPAGAAD